MSFDKKAFEGKFNAALKKLGTAEKSVRENLNELSRSTLTAVHATENIGYVNRILGVLTPVNRKVAVVFFKHFAGFHYDESTKLFTNKSKKRYNQAHQDAIVFLEDPHNNMFSWAERHIEVEQKPFDGQSFLKAQHKAFVRAVQQARDNGIDQKELFSAMFKPEEGKPGLDVNALVAVLEAMGEVELKAEEPAML